jgi:hypothetical protein
MSTLQVTNIKATGETASRAVSGVAAAWARFSGSGTASLGNSLNISSLTDNGTGNYELTVASSFSSLSASASAAQFDDGGGKTPTYVPNVSAIIVQFFSASDVLADAGHLSSTAHGDLA